MLRAFLAIFLLAWGAVWSGDPIALYMTWKRSPETTMTVRWITPLHEESSTAYYRTLNGEWHMVDGIIAALPYGHPYLVHEVEMTGLQPGGQYAFRLDEEGREWRFRTAPAAWPIRFVAGGDMYHEDNTDGLRQTQMQAAATEPHFALAGGDIAYAGSRFSFFKESCDRWIDWLKAWHETMVTPEGFTVPVLPVIGNHDVSGRYHQSPDQAQMFYALFPMPGPQGYNVLDFGGSLSIFLLDSAHTHPIEGEQTAWLDRALGARKEQIYKIAVYHVPAYPSVRKFANKMCAKVRAHWVPVFERHALTVAFEHHDHAYKRTYRLKEGRPSPEGVLYMGDGAWGVDRPRVAKQRDYLAATAGKRHFIQGTLTATGMELTAISSDGEELDKVVR